MPARASVLLDLLHHHRRSIEEWYIRIGNDCQSCRSEDQAETPASITRWRWRSGNQRRIGWCFTDVRSCYYDLFENIRKTAWNLNTFTIHSAISCLGTCLVSPRMACIVVFCFIIIGHSQHASVNIPNRRNQWWWCIGPMAHWHASTTLLAYFR